jgi:hypothetical protein
LRKTDVGLPPGTPGRSGAEGATPCNTFGGETLAGHKPYKRRCDLAQRQHQIDRPRGDGDTGHVGFLGIGGVLGDDRPARRLDGQYALLPSIMLGIEHNVQSVR